MKDQYVDIRLFFFLKKVLQIINLFFLFGYSTFLKVFNFMVMYMKLKKNTIFSPSSLLLNIRIIIKNDSRVVLKTDLF